MNRRRGVVKKIEIRKRGWPLGPADKCEDCQSGICCCPHRIRHRDGRTFEEASAWNRRSRYAMSTERHKWRTHEAERREARIGGRWGRSSDERPAMGLERRASRSGELRAGNWRCL